MLKPFETIASGTAERPAPHDLFRRLLNELCVSPTGGQILVWDRQRRFDRWVRLQNKVHEPYTALEIRYAASRAAAGWLTPLEALFPAGFAFNRFDSFQGAAVLRGALALNAALADRLAATLERIFLEVYHMGPGHTVAGWVEFYRDPDTQSGPRRWSQNTDLPRRSQTYTLEALRAMTQARPDDTIAWLMLAERTEDSDEKVNVLRRHHMNSRDIRLDVEGHKAWDRYIYEWPRYTYPDCTFDSLPMADKSTLHFDNGEWFAEKTIEVCEAPVPESGTGQAFVGRPLVFDRITKLSYADFWCRQGSTYRLYQSRASSSLTHSLSFTLDAEPTLTQVVELIRAASPPVHVRLAELLRPAREKGGFISSYRCYEWGFDDFFMHLATGFALIDDQFNVTPLPPGPKQMRPET